jgi:hypothetical protein
VECPQVPLLELAAPARDWLEEMRHFLLGMPVMRHDYSLPSTPASRPTPKLNAN